MPRLSKIGAACLAAFGWTTGAGAVTASYLVVAGGGGGTRGSSEGSGGGGAGGMQIGTTSLSPATTYTVTVGAGAASSSNPAARGNAGSNSQFGTLTASVGGGGGASGSYTMTGGDGGSGGGGGYYGTAGGSGTSGQGNAGGAGEGGGSPYNGGGGGGAGSAGSAAGANGGDGGAGSASSITGSSVTYAGGGGGGSYNATGGIGGSGGGGSGSANSTAPISGTANFGGGGGGGNGNYDGAAGGSGVVIISYPAPQLFWGGFVTTSGGNIIHTFTTSGSLAPITTSVTANYLIVAGGGGANYSGAGGGGAGGYLTSTTSLSLASSYTVTVGAGGVGGLTTATNGANSVFNSVTATGGGYGGGGGSAGAAGGSAGGSGNGVATAVSPSPAGQGNAGGGGGGASQYGGGGGGGAGGAGVTGASGGAVPNPSGGAGLANSITGTSVYYAGGGGGGHQNQSGVVPAGGVGGGGAGATSALNPVAGTANLGGGGGGGSGPASIGANGGSGVVIISYPGSQLFGGGVVTYANGYTVHTFNTSGTLLPIVSLSASYLIVAGGGGGSNESGGGGGGGMQTGAGVAIDTNSTYLVTVGAGGAPSASSILRGSNGANSTFSVVPTASVGGGGGGNGVDADAKGLGLSGGSGGGGGGWSAPSTPAVGGSGTAGQGNSGGTGSTDNITYTTGAGGGGAGAAGSNATSGGGGNGGAGLASSISGTSTYYAGGGGGGNDLNSLTYGSGGVGGGGSGGEPSTAATAGTANTGGGGGGAYPYTNAAAGGSGIVVIAYAGSVQQMAGGTVTISGGNVIHTFTSSGYLAPLKFVGNSLRFRRSANAYLSRTITTSGSSYAFTHSLWAKRGLLSTEQTVGYGLTASGGVYSAILRFNSNDTLDWYCYYNGSSWTGQLSTTQVFRDPSAWYHFVISADTTQATDSNRLKMYVNGVQVTAFSTASYPPQNTVLAYNLTGANNYTINSQNGGGTFDGEIAEVNYIDGQQLTPNAFGTFNSYGVWQPITYGGSYGTNGFYLPMTQPSTSTYSSALNGTSQSISAPSNAVFNFSGAFTVECWLKTSTTTNVSQPCVFSIGSDASGLVLTFSGTTFYGYFVGTGGLFSGVSYTSYLNSWVHIAWVRQAAGGTHYLYVNGIQVATGSSGGTVSSTGGVTVGKAGSSGTAFGYLSGTVSNFRVNNTALYVTNFTPSTSPLTAVSGTQLLTLQNSTLIDNSTNAFTITNNGSISPAVNTGVFVNPTTLVKDQSPAQNNWTPNNISTVSGSTYDSMTDVPTLTSATAANYCVLNPLRPASYSNGTLTNGNLNFANSAASYKSTNSTVYMTTGSGQWYWEVTCVSIGFVTSIGIGNIVSANGAGASGTWCYHYDGTKYVNGANSAYGASYTSGDVLGFAFDATTGSLTCYKNGTSQGVLATGLTSGPYFAFGTLYGTWNVAYNFGQQPFVYTPPSGFVALNTYNL